MVLDKKFYMPLDKQTSTPKDYSGNSWDGTVKITCAAYYPFNGNANDGSTSGNDGTVTGATLTTDHLGNTDNAYLFNGTSDYITLANFDYSTNDFTIFGWFKVDSTISDRGVFFEHRNNDYSSSGIGINFDINADGRLQGGIGDGTNYISDATDFSSTDYRDDTWHQFVLVVDRGSGEYSCYIDGSIIGTLDISSVTGAITPTVNAVIGRRDYDTDRYLKGCISELGIMNKVFYSAEVLNLYNLSSVHKLNNPFATRTDVNGDSISGFEFVGPRTDGSLPLIVVELDDFGIDEETTVSYYAKVLVDSTPSDGGIICGRIGDRNALMVRNENDFRFLQDDTSLTSNITLDFNTIYQIIATYSYDSGIPADSVWNMYIADADGVILDSVTRTGIDNYSSGTMWIGGDSRRGYQFNGVISKPIIYNTVLTEKEAYQLFKIDSVPSIIKEGDLQVQELDEIGIDNTYDIAGYYPMSGDVRDMSGNGNDGTVSGATLTTDRFGNTNNAYNFNGGADYINLGNDSSLQIGDADQSIFAWVRQDTDEDGYVYSTRNDTLGELSLFLDNGRVRAYIGNTGNNTSGVSVADGDWHHVGMVYRKTEALVDYYIDGVYIISDTSLSGSWDTSIDKQIGSRIGNSTAINGDIDDVIVIKNALTDAEVMTLYKDGFQAHKGKIVSKEFNEIDSIESPTAYYPFDGDARDVSGNGNDGTVSSATLTTDRFGNADSAYNFTDSGEYIDLGNDSSLQIGDADQSIFAWVKLGAHTDTAYIYSTRNGSSGELTMSVIDDGRIRAHIGTTSQESLGSENVLDSEWHHIGIVYRQSAGLIDYYLDGINIKTDSSVSGSWDTSVNKRIGTRVSATTFSPNGKVDDLLIIKNALTDAEVKTLYDLSSREKQMKIQKNKTNTSNEIVEVL